MQIHSGNSQSVNGSINGRGIKRRNLTHRQLVELAADAVSGAHPVAPSLSQAPKIFEGVTQSEVSEELKRRRLRAGTGETRKTARELTDVACTALEQLKDLPTDVWGACEARVIRDDIKQALKRVKMLKASIASWSPDQDVDVFPSEPAGMQAGMVEPTTVAAE